MTNQDWSILCWIAIGCITFGIPWITDSKIIRTLGAVLVVALAAVSMILYANAR